MNLHGVVVNVTDLKRSIDFYCEVLGLTLLTQAEELAAVSTSGSDDGQVIVLREFGHSPLEGGGHIGLRAFVMEAESSEQLERIASDLEARKLYVNRRVQSDWTAVVGRDPDGVSVVVAWHPGGGGPARGGNKMPDAFLYSVGE
jgi:catechol 2,3-dioxygenase-like lactoylglutathione lyase family enzyme